MRAEKGGGTKSQDTATYADMRRGAQRRATEAGGWWVQATSRWTTLRAGRGGGERLQKREATTTNANDGGDSRIEGKNEKTQKTG